MYQALLASIAEMKSEHGKSLQPPCSSEKLDSLRARFRRAFQYGLSEDYARFLATTNGLCWNGLYVFASDRSLIVGTADLWIDGVVERNREERSNDNQMNDYIAFAEDGEVSFTFNIRAGCYEVVSRVARYVDDRFSSFDELLEKALRSHV